MRLITWNLNSVKARKERLLALLERHKPDVLCLQELKAEDHAFPRAEVNALGYQAETWGERTYNGVAILSPHAISDVVRGFPGAPEPVQARLIGGTVKGVRVFSAYFPNGSEVGSSKYFYKLAWMAGLTEWLAPQIAPSSPLVLCGDYNVAPTELDAKNPEKWANSVLCSDDVRSALAKLRALGLTDSLRHIAPDQQVFSWWDYRQLGFPKNDGLRIDHLDVTECLLPKIAKVWVDREERKGLQPSDHAPVILDLLD